MKVTFQLKRDTLDIAQVIGQHQATPDAVVTASFHTDLYDQETAFNEAAIRFAKDWLTVEYDPD